MAPEYEDRQKPTPENAASHNGGAGECCLSAYEQQQAEWLAQHVLPAIEEMGQGGNNPALKGFGKFLQNARYVDFGNDERQARALGQLFRSSAVLRRFDDSRRAAEHPQSAPANRWSARPPGPSDGVASTPPSVPPGPPRTFTERVRHTLTWLREVLS